MSSSKEFRTEHPLAQNWSNQPNDKHNVDKHRSTDSQQDANSATTSSSLDYSNSLNYRHEQFARKRRESIIKMAPNINPVQQANRKLAIRCENVCLTYGEGEQTNYVLNGLTLSVPKGEIYGLLGPSGCGKTSLLKIICGLLKAEYGTVKLFGFTPGTLSSGVPGPGIGYMPQELALQSDLTIGEMLAFYGRLCLLDEKTIASQTDYLVNLLELPAKNRFIASLSGGQKRRVSLAVTIIHKPRLAILDEPTVGVDPLLCQKIWELLIDLSVNEKMTIMITTHYIEETKRANLVGFMRKGQILAEGSPELLMDYYDADTLENVFYKLCLNQKQRKTAVQHTHPARRRSIIRTESVKSARLSLKRNSEMNLNKQVQELTPQNKRKNFARQGSFTSSFGEYQQQLAKFQDLDKKTSTTSRYSTPIGSPQMEQRESSLADPNNNNFQAMKKKSDLEKEQQLELKLIDSQKYKKVPLEDISLLPTYWERFKSNYNWNPMITWVWLGLITSYKLGLQTIRQPLFLLILYVFPTFVIASLYLCIGHTPKGLKVGLVMDEVKDHRHRWPGFPAVPCNPKDKKLDYDDLFKLYDELGIKSNKNRNETDDYEDVDVVDGIGTYDRLRIPYIPEIILSNVNQEIITFVNFSSIAEAREATRVRKIWAYIHFKKEFSRSFIDRDLFLKSNGRLVTNEMINQGTIHMSGDFSDLFMSGSIQLTLLEALIDTYPKLAKQCGVDEKFVSPPVKIQEFIYGSYVKGDYFGVRDFAAPGFIMCITYSLSMGLCTLQTMLELEDKMFIRNFSVGLSPGQMIFANIVGRIFFLFGSIATMLISSVNLFQIPIYGSYFDAFHILILQTLVGMTNGLFFATLLREITACLFVSIGFLLFIFFISGVFWPLEALPYYVRWFSRSLPFTVPGESFRTVLIRKGAPMSYIYPGILMSYVWLFVFLSLSYWTIRRRKYDE